MIKSSQSTLKGGIFTHLVKSLDKKPGSAWSQSQFGGSGLDDRQTPFVLFGKCEHRLWRSVTFDGEHHRVNLEIYCGEEGLESAKGYAGNIIAALHGADFPIKGHALIEIQFEQASYIKKAGRNEYLARLLFTVLTIVD